MLQVGRQILTDALAAEHFEVVWAGCAALVCLVVALVVAGTSGTGDHRRVRRAGRAAGLTRREANVLRHLVRAGQLRQEGELFRNRALLDAVLRRGAAIVRGAGSPDGVRYRQRLAILLSIKARAVAAVPAAIRSLSPFQEGEGVTLARATHPAVETSLLAGIGDELACAWPVDQATHTPLRAGMQVTVRPAAAARGSGGSVATVLGRGWVAGQPALLLTRRTALSGNIRPRGGRRRCEVTPLTVARGPSAGALRTASGEAPVVGALVSLDAQWAGVRSVAPVAAGRLVKLVLELGRAVRLPLYGKVVQSPRRGAAGVMLVHLTGLSRSRISDLYRFVDEVWSSAATGAGRRG